MSGSRYVVVLSRSVFDAEDLYFSSTPAVFGPFRTREKAESRAATIRKLALTYEDPEGVTGENNALNVSVEQIWPGWTSAQEALICLYEAI